jgi:hypothetical protein
MNIKLPSLVITTSFETSNVIGGALLDWLAGLEIMSPETLSGEVSVEVADLPPEEVTDGDFRVLQSGGDDVVLSADRATPITQVSFRSLRLATTVAPGDDEEYAVVGHEKDVQIYG